MARPPQTCECSDPGCKQGHKEMTCARPASAIVRRVDMEDGETRFRFCDVCTEDAMESGVFDVEGL